MLVESTGLNMTWFESAWYAATWFYPVWFESTWFYPDWFGSTWFKSTWFDLIPIDLSLCMSSQCYSYSNFCAQLFQLESPPAPGFFESIITNRVPNFPWIMHQHVPVGEKSKSPWRERYSLCSYLVWWLWWVPVGSLRFGYQYSAQIPRFEHQYHSSTSQWGSTDHCVPIQSLGWGGRWLVE